MRTLEQLLTWLLVDPDRREVILGDLEETRATRGAEDLGLTGSVAYTEPSGARLTSPRQ